MMSNADQTRQQHHECETDAAAVRHGALLGPQRASTDEYQVGLLLSDFEGLVCYADAYCRTLTGEIMRGEPWTHVVAQEDRDWVEAAWTESLLSRLPFCAEFRIESCRPHWVLACGVYGIDAFDDGMLGWTVHFMDCGFEQYAGEAACHPLASARGVT